MAAVVKLRGLPWSVTEYQIVDFFRPVPVGVESVTLITGRDGRASGEGYVWIHENNMNQALTYNRRNIGNRYIEVFPSDEAEYTAAVQNSNLVAPSQQPIAAPRPSAPGAQRGGKGGAAAVRKPAAPQTATESVVRVRGLPFSATVQDLVGLFADYGVDESSVYMGVTNSGPRAGSPSGDGFIRFNSVEAAQKALTHSQGVTLGSRYLELFAASETEIEAMANVGGIAGYEANQGSGNADVNPQENRAGSGWLRLRGLPFSATQKEVMEFMGNQFYVSENDITIKYGTDGRPSGEAFVQMDSEETATAAQAALDRKTLGSRYLEVFVSTYEESQATRTNRSGPYSGGKGFGGKGAPYAAKQEFGKGKGKGKVSSGYGAHRNVY